MNTLPYISDNPFRLLGVGSSSLLAELRHLAKRGANAAKVGIVDHVGLAELLGADDLTRCDDIVRAMAADPTRRTLYRMCWVSGTGACASGISSLDDIAPGADATQVEHLACRFLRHWIAFGRRPSRDSLAEALSAFRELYELSEFDEYLADLLVQEGVPQADAMDKVYEAQDKLIAHLLETGCQRGVDLLERGDVATAQSLIEAVCEAEFQDEWVDKAVLTVVPTGERELVAVQRTLEVNEEWTPTSGYYDGADICKLRALADALYGRHPAATRWRETVDERLDQMVSKMRGYAFRLVETEKNFPAALDVLAHVHRLPLSEEWLQVVQDDILRIGIKQEASERDASSSQSRRRKLDALADTCRHAMVLWETGDKEAALSLLTSVCHSSGHASVLGEALEAVRAVGNGEMARIRQEAAAFRRWQPSDGDIDLRRVSDLRRLADAVSDHLSVTSWREACDQRVRQVAFAMRSYAIDLANNQGEYEQALQIVRRAADMDLPLDVRERVRQDLCDLIDTIEKQKHYAKLAPLKSVPSLYTLNGIGTKVYGSRRFEGREDWYYKTLYFVVLYLPILPLKQYVVSRAHEDGWYFHAIAPFGRRNRYHLAGGLACIAALIVWAMVASNAPSDARPGASDVNTSSPQAASFPEQETSAPAVLPSPFSPGDAGTGSDTAPVSTSSPEAGTPSSRSEPSPEIVSLRAEYTRLKSELTEESERLKSERDAVDSEIRSLNLESDLVDNRDQAAVDEYNGRVRAANARKDAFNESVDEHNAKVRRLKRVVARLRALGD